MYKHLIIRDRSNKYFLSTSLKDLLEDITPFMDNYVMGVFELDGFLYEGVPEEFGLLIDKINETKEGYIIDLTELKRLANELTQVINLILVISDSKNNFIQYVDSDEWRKKQKIIIEIVDGDYWEVYSSNDKLISHLEHKYKDTEVRIIM